MVSSFAERVGALLDEVVSLDNDTLDIALRLYLIQHLRAIRSALEEYKVRGSSEVSTTVRSSVGDFGTDRPEIRNEHERSLWKKFVEVCKDLIVVTTVTTQLATAPMNVLQAFEKLDHDRPVASAAETPALPSGSVPALGPGPSAGETPAAE